MNNEVIMMRTINCVPIVINMGARYFIRPELLGGTEDEWPGRVDERKSATWDEEV